MGLIDAQPAIQQESPQQEQPQQSSGDEETYRRIGLAAMKLIYTKPESDALLEILKAGKDQPADAVAKATFAVIKRLQNDIEGINPNLAYAVAPAVIALIFEIGEEAGLFTEETLPENADPQQLIAESLAILAQMAKEPQQPQQPQQMGV